MSIHKDVYSIIIKFSSWFTLLELRKVNKKLFELTQEEINNRLKSIYPFGDSKAKLEIVTKDIILYSISCNIDGRKIFIPEDKYKKRWVRTVINTWFNYSLSNQQYILSNQLYKSMIRIFNRKLSENNSKPIDETTQTLVFGYNDEITLLEHIF